MTTRPNIDNLRLQIRNVRCQSMDRRLFVPEASLQKIFTLQAIARAVAELKCQPEDHIGLADAIRLQGVTTFAILIWMNREDSIVGFRRWECLESARLSEDAVSVIAPSFGLDFVREYSWQFRPHFFHRGDDIEINERKILPFLRDMGQVAEGGFGTVNKIEVHPLLQDFYPNHDPVVIVRKSLRKEGSHERRKSLFNNEKRCLLLLNSRRNPNIIPFFGAYTYGQEFCFLFPVFEMDLKQLFQRDRYYGDFQWDFTFIAALQGLSSALSYVHDVRLQLDTEGVDFSGIGYHHDLRPANILVTKKTFVLADFGLGRLKSAEENSRTRWKAGAGDYIAPECMNDELDHQRVGRTIDVWAFGCLLAEVAAFMRTGFQGLEDFCQARLDLGSFANLETSYFHNTQGCLKDSVKKWLNGFFLNHYQLPIHNNLHSLVYEILVPVAVRPNISDIVLRLSRLNVKAHYYATLECFDKIVEEILSESRTPRDSRTIWCERERLKAFGNVLYLDDDERDSQFSEIDHLEGEKCVKILRQLFETLRTLIDTDALLSNVDESKANGNCFELESQPFHAKTPSVFAADIQNIVKGLLNLLPAAQLKKAQSVWGDAILERDKINQLGGLDRTKSDVYRQDATLATIGRTCPEPFTGCTNNPELGDMKPPHSYVTEPPSVQSHQISHHGWSAQDIIDWMF